MRFLAYFLGVFAALFVLRQLPLVGGLFQVPILGFFLAALVVSALVARGGTWLTQRNKLQRQLRELGEVDTPQRRGKLGRLLLQSGRPAQALEPLREAIAEDPETVDWHYRLGMALLRTGEVDEAVTTLQRARELDEGFAYGGVLLQLAAAAQAQGDFDLALDALARFEILQGPTPEQTYRRGLALKAKGDSTEAKAAFAAVPAFVARVPKYQRAEARAWGLRAWWAGLI